MHWEPNALVPLFAVFLYGVLFLVVTFSKSSTQIQERRIFREYLLAMLVWSVIAFLVLIGIGDVVFEFRLMLVSALLSMVALFRFVQTVLSRRWRWVVWVYLYAVASHGNQLVHQLGDCFRLRSGGCIRRMNSPPWSCSLRVLVMVSIYFSLIQLMLRLPDNRRIHIKGIVFVT